MKKKQKNLTLRLNLNLWETIAIAAIKDKCNRTEWIIKAIEEKLK